jgi:hypothetical protein
MLQIFINDTLCELSGNDIIALDYSVAKIGEMDKRSGSRSNEIKLPKTAINRAIFENPDDVDSISKIPYRRLKARVIVDGIDQNMRFATLLSSKDSYNIRVYGAQVDFYSTIKDSKLSDLDLHKYDYFHRIQHVVDERASREISFSIIDNFSDSPNSYITNAQRQVDIRYLPPAIGYEFLLDKMVTAAGYTLSNKAKELYRYPENFMGVPFTKKKWVRDKDAKRYLGRYDWTSTSIGVVSKLNFTAFNTPGYDYNYFQNPAPSSWIGDIFLNDYLAYTCKIQLYINNASASPQVMQIEVFINGVLHAYNFTIPASASNHPVLINVSSGYEMPDGLQHSIQNIVGYNNNVNISVASGYFEVTSALIVDDIVEVDRTQTIYNNWSQEYVTINSLLPDWKQGDFLKYYCWLTSSLIIVDEFTKTVSLVPFKTVADNVSRFKNWSDKIDLTDTPEVLFNLGEYSQRNKLLYADDETVQSKPTGTDSSLDIDDENLPFESIFFELPFASTMMKSTIVDVSICQISVWTDDGTKYSGNLQPRIIVVRPHNTAEETPTTGLSYFDGSTYFLGITSNIPFTHFIKDGEFFNLGFGNNVVEKMYQALEGVLDRAKIPSLLLRINASDINQLDFTVPVYIEYFNAYFYISQIREYKPGSNESTLVELVKLF